MVWLLVALAIIGIALAMFPMDATIRKIIIFLAIVLTLFTVLSFFGVQFPTIHHRY